MINFQIIKRDGFGGNSGIQDRDTGRVIIPCMYGTRELENIIEIIPINNGNAYILKGLDIDNNVVYGLYNAFTNGFVLPIYESVYLDELVSNGNIKFSKDGKMVYYNLEKNEENVPLKTPVKLINKDYKTYGIANADDKIIIPPVYERREVFNIGDVIKTINDVYILKDKRDKIIGFYDSKRHSLKKIDLASFEVVDSVLILKGIKVRSNEKSKHLDRLLAKSRVSVYDTRNGKYIEGNYYDEFGKKYYSDGYYSSYYVDDEYECVSKFNRILILDGKDFYDTKTGFLYHEDNVRCSGEDGKIIIETDEFDAKFVGCYDLKTRTLEKYNILSSSFKTTDKLHIIDFEFYLSQDKTQFYFWSEFYPVEEYTDFIKFSTKEYTFFFDKEYNLISYIKRKLRVLEIKPTDIEQLGIPVNKTKPVYLINGELLTYKKNIKKAKGTRYANFIKIPTKAVGAVEYEYGICEVLADCDSELDFILDELEERKKELAKIVENNYYQDAELREEYPKLVRKKK